MGQQLEYIKHLMQDAETNSRRRSADAGRIGTEDVRKTSGAFDFWGGYSSAIHDALEALDGRATVLAAIAADREEPL